MKSIIREDVMQSDLTAIRDDKGNQVTYNELAEKAERLSQYVEERSLIFILCDHAIETAEFIYEILYLNRVPLMLASDVNEDFLDAFIKIYKPQYIYCSEKHPLKQSYPYKIKYEKHFLLETGNKRNRIHPDIALLLSTSGTTGSPKLVKLSYGNLYDNAEYACRHIGIGRGQKGISPLSMGYVYGLNFCLWHWHCGATLLLTEEPVFSSKFAEFYTKEKANNFAGIPYTYQMMQRVRFWDCEKLKYLHRAMSGGAQMSDEDQRSMISLMKEKFWILYGQTECTGTVTGMNFDQDNIKSGSVGTPFGNAKALIDGTTKELILKGSSICMGYADNRLQLADGDMNNGILHTGDIVFIDEEGCIYLKGRLSRYVKILGKRISLDDIEQFLNNNFPVIETACTGEDDSITVCYAKSENELNKEIVSLLDCKLQIPKKFVSCRKVKEIPRNNAGKIMYAELGECKNE